MFVWHIFRTFHHKPDIAVRRGRQLFQRKFTRAQGQGPLEGDGVVGDINSNLALGAGLADSCAGCHGRPRGSAGFAREDLVRSDGGRGNPFVRLFAVANASFNQINDGTGHPTLKRPRFGAFLVKNIYTDFKRHDLGPNFHEINYDGTIQRQFLTTPLWGVGSTPPYGHDGRSPTLQDVIRRHGGEAQVSRDRFTRLLLEDQERIIAFLNFLVLFPPDDTPSNLNPANPGTQGYPQFGHGSINLTALFNNPSDVE